MGVFHVFKIVQIVLNCAKHHITDFQGVKKEQQHKIG